MSLYAAVEAIVLSILKRRRKVNNVCEVISVNKTNNTCNVKDSSNFVINDVRLLAVVDDFDKKFVVYPKVGSSVAISYLFETADKAVVIKYSEIDEIILNGDDFGGLVKADVLKTELNKLKDYCETLKASTKTALAVSDALAAGTSAAFEASMLGKTTGDFSDIENEKVKHG